MDDEKEEPVFPQVEETVADESEAGVIQDQEQVTEETKETKVPLSALQKERRKRQELENRLQYLESQQKQEPDTSKYESATKEDLSKKEFDIIRKIEETNWVKSNADKYERLNELLPEFLKQRPHLALAINSRPNRYEEAWELMQALTPKQQAQLKPQGAKKEAPGTPTSVPKGAAMNQAVDVMTMSDAEFNAWRQSKRQGR